MDGLNSGAAKAHESGAEVPETAQNNRLDEVIGAVIIRISSANLPRAPSVVSIIDPSNVVTVTHSPSKCTEREEGRESDEMECLLQNGALPFGCSSSSNNTQGGMALVSLYAAHRADAALFPHQRPFRPPLTD